MPFYLVTVKLRDKAPIQVVREYPEPSLELVFQKLHFKSQEKYGRNLVYFNCMMLSKLSQEVKTFIEKKSKQGPGRTGTLGK